MTEGHFIFGNHQSSQSATDGHQPASYDAAVADPFADMLGAMDDGPSQSGSAEAFAISRAEHLLVNEAPGVLEAFDIHMGLEASDPRIRQLVKEATYRGIMDEDTFRKWIVNVAGVTRQAGYRLNLDSILFYLEGVRDAKRQFASPPDRL